MDLDQLTCSFFGLAETSDHRRLLGVSNNRNDQIAFDIALRRRIAQIYSHPRGRSEEASLVKKHLEKIAIDLKSQFDVSEKGTLNQNLELTPLDQSILAFLIGEGGWNRQSRARLVAVAASYQITVGGLMRILQALGESSRDGGGPLSRQRRSDTKMSRAWTSVPKQKTTMDIVDEFLSNAAKKLTPELSESNPIMTMKLAALFCLLTILAFVLSLQVLLSPEAEKDNLIDEVSSNQNSNFIAPGMSSAKVLVRPFDSYPSIEDAGNLSIFANAADQATTSTRELQKLVVRIQETLRRGGKPLQSWIVQWDSYLQTASIAWLEADQSLSLAIVQSIEDFLKASEQDMSFNNQVINEMKPNKIDFSDSNSVCSRVWRSSIIATMRCNENLSAQSRSRLAKIQLQSVKSCEANEAKKDSLLQISEQLIEMTELDERTMAMWNTWISSSRAIRDESISCFLFSEIMESILRGPIDLSRESQIRKVLGRIIRETNWEMDAAKQLIKELLAAESISGDDVWVLTHLLHASKKMPWFDEQFLAEAGINSTERLNLAKVIESSWPEIAIAQESVHFLAMPLGFNAAFSESWLASLKEINPTKELTNTLVKLRKLNEAAAAIWSGRPAVAAKSLDQSKEFSLAQIPKAIMPRFPDGSWRDDYYDSNRSADSRISVLDELSSSGSTDLGVEDADLLASIAITNGSNKLRAKATEIIVGNFAYGKNVVVAILNNLHRAHPNATEEIASIVAQLTDGILPNSNNPEWIIVARKSILQHAIALGKEHAMELDSAAYELAQSLIAELIFVSPNTMPPSSESNAVEAFEILLDGKRSSMPHLYAPERAAFNATGVMQEYLKLQLEYLILLRSEELRWRGQDPSQLQVTFSDELFASSDILSQLVNAEYSIARHWEKLIRELLGITRDRNNV